MQLSEGKIKRMNNLADSRGVIGAAAMDQRGSLEKAIKKHAGASETSAAAMQDFKAAVTKVLTPHASAILLDPEFGLPASKQRAANAGLLLAYEKSGYDNDRPGRLPDLLPEWTVRKIMEQGADAIKLLLYYTPFEDAAINAEKHSFVERVGVECDYNQIPFFLEFIGYDPKGGDGKDPEYAKRKPEIVTGSVAEFSKPEYHVDVLKIEIPVNLQYIEGTRSYKGPAAYSCAEALDHYRRAADAAKRPFIFLSAGVSNDQFLESLEMAAEAGVRFNGVLCGRATWQEGIPLFAKQGREALEKWLADTGVRNIKALNKRLAPASPWFASYGVDSADKLLAASS